MDGNNTTPQTTVQEPAAAPVITPAQPVMPQASIPSNMPSNGSNKILLWFVVGLVVVILAVGGIYFYLSKQPTQTTTSQSAITTVQASPSPAGITGLESDLNNISVDMTEVSNDFAPVDQDLQQL